MKNTILFGNGINNLSENKIPWSDLLEKIKGASTFHNGNLPNTYIYERAIMESKISKNIRESEYKVKQSISELLHPMESNNYYKLLFELKCENYLTTNYDYSFKKHILNTGKYEIINESTESVYSIRRHEKILNIENEKEICKIWNIHGEISKPISIMLGLDHYCGSVSKLDAYVKGTYEFQENSEPVRPIKMSEKLKNKKFDNYSWAELIFNTNIHIIGLSLDFSETDLWWILTKRARMIKDEKTNDLIQNKIFFYDRYIKDDKEELLKSLNVIVIKPKKDNYEDNWGDYYYDSIKQIKANIPAANNG